MKKQHQKWTLDYTIANLQVIEINSDHENSTHWLASCNRVLELRNFEIWARWHCLSQDPSLQHLEPVSINERLNWYIRRGAWVLQKTSSICSPNLRQYQLCYRTWTTQAALRDPDLKKQKKILIILNFINFLEFSFCFPNILNFVWFSKKSLCLKNPLNFL